MLFSLIEILILVICILLSVAYLTIAERKTLGFMQRRVGPYAVGYYGLLMCFADALKLLIKEIILPRESNYIILIITPIIYLCSALINFICNPPRSTNSNFIITIWSPILSRNRKCWSIWSSISRVII